MFAWRGVLHILVRVLHRQIAPFLLYWDHLSTTFTSSSEVNLA